MLWLDYYWHKVLRKPYTLARRIDKGRGQPVVFLHGIASNGENWHHVADLLDSKKYRTIAFDLLGFGNSPQPDWLQYSVDDHAKAVLASLRRLRVRGPIILVGHSMGSLVAAHIARQHPRKVKHLILYQMPIYSNIPKLDVKDFRRQAYLSTFNYLADHPRVTLWYARILGRTASKISGFSLDKSTWQPFEMSLKNTIIQQRSHENLRKLRMPTDVIYGRYDVLVLRRHIQHFFRPSKYLRFYEIDELHRISARAGQLIRELIVQDPRQERKLRSKHARLIPLINMPDPIKKTPEQPQTNKRTYALLSAMSMLVFIITAVAAWPGTINGWELEVFNFFNRGSESLLLLARIASDIVWAVVFLVAAMFLFKKYFWTAWRISVPAVSTYVIVYIMEAVVGRARPEVLLIDTAYIRAVQDGMGFPSGHVATITAIIVTIWPYLSKLYKVVAVVLIIAVAWSRIYLGLHFPLDIIGGVAIGISIACLIKALPQSFLVKYRLSWPNKK